MAFIRLPLILLGNGAIVLALRLAGQPAGVATGAVFFHAIRYRRQLYVPGLLLWRARVEDLQFGTIAGVAFPILNPLIEGLQYRGYAQPRLLAASGRVWLGIGIPAAGFGLQHVAFAYTLSATPAYAVGYFLWGFGAGMIAYRQKRLAPLIIAHFISNLSFGIVPLFFVLRGV
jgi:membrane protease YdiL (CAAX protease family)